MICTGQIAPRLPTVLTEHEVSAVFTEMNGIHALMARLLYRTGMRLMECMMLRVKDANFGRREITIRVGKGGKDRVTMLQLALVGPLREQIALARTIYDADRAEDRPGVMLPDALERKYPKAALQRACRDQVLHFSSAILIIRLTGDTDKRARAAMANAICFL